MAHNEVQYAYLYKLADEDKDGFVGSNDALRFFQRSSLSKEILALIWGTVNQNNSPHLTLHQFILACQLITLAQNGRQPTLQELAQNPHVPIPNFAGVSIPSAAPAIPQIASAHNQQSSIISSNSGERREFVWAITPQLLSDFSQKFAGLDTDQDGFISGQQAAAYLGQSELSPQILVMVWELADVNKDGKLDVKEFCLAMFVVHALKAGHQVPTPLPQSLISSIWNTPVATPVATPVSSVTSPVPIHTSPWSITQQELTYWNQIFDSNDFDRSGKINGQNAKELLTLSKLPTTELGTIYSLCDLDKDGHLSRVEFYLAMKLIQVRSAGNPLPNELPNELKQFAQSINPSITFPQPSSSPYTSTPTSSNPPPVSVPLTKTPSTPIPKDDSKTIEDLQNQLRASETKVKELQLQITSITNQRNQIENNYKKVVSDKKTVESDLRDAQLKLSKANDRAHEFESKLIQAEAKLSVLGSRGADPTAAFTQQIERKDQELTQLREKLRLNESKLAETESKFADLKLEIKQSPPPQPIPINFTDTSVPVPPPPPFSQQPSQTPSVLPPPSNPTLPPAEPVVGSFSIANPPSTASLSSDNPFLLGLNIPSGGSY